MRKGMKWFIAVLIVATLGWLIVPVVMGWFVMM